MLHVGVGHSTNAVTGRAVEEAAGQAMGKAGLRQADLALVFFTVDHLNNAEELTSGLSRRLQTDQVVGCSAGGILTGDGEIEGGTALAVMVLSSDSLQAVPFLLHPLRNRELEVGEAIASELRSAPGENTHLILLPDPYNGRPDTMVQKIQDDYGFVPVLGAGCSESAGQGKTFQLCGSQVTHNGVSGLVLTGSLESSIGVTQGCQPVSQPMVITKAEGNYIYEIDHRPAVDVFASAIKGPLLQDLRRALAFVFVGLPSEPASNSVGPGDYVVRNIIGLDSQRGILAVGDQVRQGEAMIFTLREGQRAREDLDQMLHRQAEALGGKTPQFGLYFNCCARGSSLYGYGGIDTAYIRRSLGDFPLIGMFGNFELGPVGRKNQLLAYTGVLALFREKPLQLQ